MEKAVLLMNTLNVSQRANNEFSHKMSFSAIPTITPHIDIDLNDKDAFINYHIRQKKYQKIVTFITFLRLT